MAFSSLSLSLSLLLYSGSSSTLKQVWDVGNLHEVRGHTLEHCIVGNVRSFGHGLRTHLSVSGPFLAMIIFSLPSPPTGARSVPVVNCRKRRFCSSLNECNVSQNSLQGDRGDMSHRQRTETGRCQWRRSEHLNVSSAGTCSFQSVEF